MYISILCQIVCLVDPGCRGAVTATVSVSMPLNLPGVVPPYPAPAGSSPAASARVHLTFSPWISSGQAKMIRIMDRMIHPAIIAIMVCFILAIRFLRLRDCGSASNPLLHVEPPS